MKLSGNERWNDAVYICSASAHIRFETMSLTFLLHHISIDFVHSRLSLVRKGIIPLKSILFEFGMRDSFIDALPSLSIPLVRFFAQGLWLG
mmetsp:Transcript_14757/g.37124  ORF Transcript_14757/g.37124 Transcript_14757/m.37124 type:complete len:91 (-) Transcript_14757:601-873(-)